MPYICRQQGDKWILTKRNSTSAMGTHSSAMSCNKQMRALYAADISNSATLRIDGTIMYMPHIDAKIAESKDDITVLINSRGGDFMEGLSIHNKLRASGKKIICYIDPLAGSAAAVIALAGDEVYMVANGLMFFHLPKAELYGVKDETELKVLAEALNKSTEVLVNTIVSRTKKTPEEARELLNDTWLTPSEALAMGLIDEIIPIRRDVRVENYFPERIVNFIKETDNMGLKEIAQQIGLSDVEVTDDSIVAYINKLKCNQKVSVTPVSDSIVNMVKRSRETELDSLVSSGKLTPVVVNELKIAFASAERIQKDCNGSDEEYTKLVNALGKNEVVLSFAGKSGTQTVPKGESEKDDEAQMAVKDMQKRLAK